MKYIIVTMTSVVLLLSVYPAFSAVLHGQVLRRNMAPVGNTEIVLKKKGSNDEKKTKTNSSGVYSIELDSGAYLIEVDGETFEVRISDKKKRKDLKLP